MKANLTQAALQATRILVMYLVRSSGRAQTEALPVTDPHPVPPPGYVPHNNMPSSVSRPELPTTAERDIRPVSSEKGTSCIPCATNHLSTCSGLMSEALRFARADGLASTDVVERIGLCQDELNAMERVDLRAEKVSQLSGREKELANQVLRETRGIRHGLEHMQTVDDLEKVTAGMQGLRTSIGKQWVVAKIEDKKDNA